MKLLPIVLLAVCFSAQAKKPTEPLVTFKKPKQLVLKAGESKMAIFEFVVTKGFHVQSNPASEKYLIPTVLKMESSKVASLETPVYPPCKEGKALGPCKPHKLSGSKKAINTYEGTFQVKVPVKASKKGKASLNGKLRYQACNDHTCFFPKTISVSLPFVAK